MGPVLTWETDTMLDGRFSTGKVQHALIAGYILNQRESSAMAQIPT
jgi:hypothetical protein